MDDRGGVARLGYGPETALGVSLFAVTSAS